MSEPARPAAAFPPRAPWSLEMGAAAVPGGVRFKVWAPEARRAEVRLEGGGAAAMRRQPGGVFAAFVRGAKPGALYRYRIDGAAARPDPVSRHQPRGVHGPSAVVRPHYPWKAARWKGVDPKRLVLYELHVGTFTPEGTFAAAAGRLAHLRALGVTMVELMPVAEFPGARNWGYDGTNLYAPHSAYGGPEGLKAFVDACHLQGLGVCLDVVYNHLGPEGNYLHGFGPYFTDRYRTPWGQALNTDGPGSDGPRRWVIENALYWLTEYRVDALRLDTVDHIFDFSAVPVVAELKAACAEQARRLGRRVQVIAEADANDSRLIRESGRGGWGLDAQWSDDFHHAVHARLTGERGGYYRDFGAVSQIAKALSEGWIFDGRYNAHRGCRKGSRAADLPGERFVFCLQNHDQIGNRRFGERLTSLVGLEAHKAAAVLMLCAPQTPLLFMGEEWAEDRPFLYFTSHGDPALAKAVREGRKREFAHFHGGGATPDPQDPATFEASRLDWTKPHRPPHAEVLALYRELLRLRLSRPALSNGRMDLMTAVHGGSWLAYERRDPGGDRLAVACNLGPRAATLRWPFGSCRQTLLSTRPPRFAGGRLLLEPRSAAVFAPARARP